MSESLDAAPLDVSSHAEDYCVPDGIGLTLDAVRALLAREHQTILGPDDPVLMLVTLHNAFLGEYERLLARHNKALTALLAEKTDGYVAGVLQATEALGKDLSAASIESMRGVLQQHSAALKAFRLHLLWLAGIVVASALGNVIVFVFLGGR